MVALDFHIRHMASITGCVAAQHCYDLDVSFLWEKMETLTPCKIETLEHIDTICQDYVHVRNVSCMFGENPSTVVGFWANG